MPIYDRLHATQRLASALSVMPGKCRRSSTMADSSPLSSYAERMASAVESLTQNILPG